MDRNLALLATLAVGGLVAFQAPGNALLAREVGDLGAALTSLVISGVIVGVLLVVAGDPGELAGLRDLRPVHLLGGLGGAAIVLVGLVAVRQLGAGGVTAALVATQLAMSALGDRYGWVGLERSPLTAAKLAGIGLLLLGTWLVTLA
jgi:transporter family-2 protein